MRFGRQTTLSSILLSCVGANLCDSDERRAMRGKGARRSLSRLCLGIIDGRYCNGATTQQRGGATTGGSQCPDCMRPCHPICPIPAASVVVVAVALMTPFLELT